MLFLDKSDVSGCDVRSALLSTGVLIRIEPEIRCRKLTSLATYITGTEQFYNIRIVKYFVAVCNNILIFVSEILLPYLFPAESGKFWRWGWWPTGGWIRQALVRESGKESI